jgi:hypothetical protein
VRAGLLCGGLFISGEGEEFREAGFEGGGIEIAFDRAVVAEGNHAGFLADDDDDGIGFLAESEAGAVAEAEVAVEVGALGDGEDAGAGEEAFAAQDESAVVQGGFGMEEGDDQFGAQEAVERNAAFGPGVEGEIAFDGDECPELAVGEVEGEFAEDLDGFAVLAAEGEEGAFAEGGGDAAEFGLEDDDEGEEREGRGIAQQPVEHGEVQHLRQQEHGERSDQDTQKGADPAGFAQADPDLMGGQPEQRDFNGVAPVGRGEGEGIRGIHAAPSLRMASVMRSACALGRTSWTRRSTTPRERA